MGCCRKWSFQTYIQCTNILWIKIWCLQMNSCGNLIKIFIWLLIKYVILIKDNLIKKHWKGSENWCFENKETIQPFFYLESTSASRFWFITATRRSYNLFENWLQTIVPKSRLQIWVGIECHMLVHFSGLEMILYLTKERIYSYM
jgi:hypothetical protein